MKSLAIKTDTKQQRDLVVEFFISKGYSLTEKLNDGLAIFIVPSVKGLLVTFNSIADDNAKEGYPLIDFETFMTIAA